MSKRFAERQISKDDQEDEGSEEAGTFETAHSDEMNQRRYF